MPVFVDLQRVGCRFNEALEETFPAKRPARDALRPRTLRLKWIRKTENCSSIRMGVRLLDLIRWLWNDGKLETFTLHVEGAAPRQVTGSPHDASSVRRREHRAAVAAASWIERS
jgi:hypothetical protein